MKYTIHSQALREGQYHLLYSAYDDDGKLIIGNGQYTVGYGKIDDKEIEALFTYTIFPQLAEPKIEAAFETEETMMISEVENLLKEKGLLATDEKLEDLKTITEIEAAVSDAKVVEAVK